MPQSKGGIPNHVFLVKVQIPGYATCGHASVFLLPLNKALNILLLFLNSLFHRRRVGAVRLQAGQQWIFSALIMWGTPLLLSTLPSEPLESYPKSRCDIPVNSSRHLIKTEKAVVEAEVCIFCPSVSSQCSL